MVRIRQRFVEVLDRHHTGQRRSRRPDPVIQRPPLGRPRILRTPDSRPPHTDPPHSAAVFHSGSTRLAAGWRESLALPQPAPAPPCWSAMSVQTLPTRSLPLRNPTTPGRPAPVDRSHAFSFIRCTSPPFANPGPHRPHTDPPASAPAHGSPAPGSCKMPTAESSPAPPAPRPPSPPAAPSPPQSPVPTCNPAIGCRSTRSMSPSPPRSAAPAHPRQSVVRILYMVDRVGAVRRHRIARHALVQHPQRYPAAFSRFASASESRLVCCPATGTFATGYTLSPL